MATRLATALFIITVAHGAAVQADTLESDMTMRPISAAEASEIAQAAIQAAVDDGWRRTAHGWERMSDWLPHRQIIDLCEPSAPPLPPPSGLAAVNPILFALVQGIFGVLVLLLARPRALATTSLAPARQMIAAPHCLDAAAALRASR